VKNIVKAFIFLLILNFSIFAQGVGTQAPDFTHNTLDHGQISLSDYQGKVVYLFFFGWG
jgi:peroxiredoxin